MNPPSFSLYAKRSTTFLVGDVDALPLRVFESLFATSFLVWMGNCMLCWREWLTDTGFHLTSAELGAMGYPEPLPLLPAWAVPFLALAILVSSLALMFNLWRRWALAALFLLALYVQGADFMAAFTLNKLFVGVFGILCFSPGYERDKATRKLMVSALSIRVIQATLILQYFAAGLAKASADWLHGDDVLYTQVQGVYRTDIAAWLLRTLPLWAWTVQQHVSLVFELTAPLLFCVRRLRWVAFLIGMGFHLVIALLMKDLILFSQQMWTFYALFITAAEWRSIGGWVRQWTLRILGEKQMAGTP